MATRLIDPTLWAHSKLISLRGLAAKNLVAMAELIWTRF